MPKMESAVDVERMVEMLREGRTLAYCGLVFGVSRERCRQLAKKAGVDQACKGWRREKRIAERKKERRWWGVYEVLEREFGDRVTWDEAVVSDGPLMPRCYLDGKRVRVLRAGVEKRTAPTGPKYMHYNLNLPASETVYVLVEVDGVTCNLVREWEQGKNGRRVVFLRRGKVHRMVERQFVLNEAAQD